MEKYLAGEMSIREFGSADRRKSLQSGYRGSRAAKSLEELLPIALTSRLCQLPTIDDSSSMNAAMAKG